MGKRAQVPCLASNTITKEDTTIQISEFANTTNRLGLMKAAVVDLNVRFEESTTAVSAIESDDRLAATMVRDRLFVEATERGLDALDQGRYSKLEDVKRRLGDI